MPLPPLAYAFGLLTLLALALAILSRWYRRPSAALVLERDRLEERVLERTAELSREERNFRGLIEAAPDAIIVSDGSRRIVKVNSESERLFGYDRERLVGADVGMVIPPHGELKNREPLGRRSDGHTFPVEIRVGSLESGDGPLTVVSSETCPDVLRPSALSAALSTISENASRNSLHFTAWRAC